MFASTAAGIATGARVRNPSVATGRVPPIPVERRPWGACAHTLEQLERGEITGRVVLDIE
jgi:hypothetical protein